MDIIVVRHGQAQSGATDEASYDNLSPLGRQQAGWAGQYLSTLGPFERVVTGTLNRQVDTGAGLDLPGVTYTRDARLNEMDYFGLAGFLRDERGMPVPTTQEEFQIHVRDVLGHWSRAETGPDLESYAHFRDRVLGAMVDIAATGQRTVVVSSTGVIATLMAIALDLDIARKTDVFLRIAHTSLHRFEIVDGAPRLLQFCATPHLDTPERVHARTMI